MPLTINDHVSGSDYDIDIEGSKKVSNIKSHLLSLLLMVDDGWEFHLTKDELMAYTPSGQRVSLKAGFDGTLRLPCTIREGASSAKLPTGPICVAKQTTEASSADFLHRLFNHASMRRLRRR